MYLFKMLQWDVITVFMNIIQYNMCFQPWLIIVLYIFIFLLKVNFFCIYTNVSLKYCFFVISRPLPNEILLVGFDTFV